LRFIPSQIKETEPGRVAWFPGREGEKAFIQQHVPGELEQMRVVVPPFLDEPIQPVHLR
jgi:hypothetical protein